MEQETAQAFPLSPQQERIWRLQQSGGDAVAYRAQCAMFIEGDLDAGFLQAALKEVVSRHEILRATFRHLPGFIAPLQVIGEESAVQWRSSHHALVSERREAEIELLLRAEAEPGFDLEHGPLVRSHLVTLGPRHHLLLLTLPAYCADSVTLTTLVHELACVCNGGAEGEALQYTVIADWLNELVQSEEAELGRRYWRRLGAVDLLDASLPFASASRGGAFAPRRAVRLDTPTAVDQGSSLAGVLLAAWQTLLARASGRSEVVVGTLFDGRTDQELQGAVGTMARYLPLRGPGPDDLPFLEVVHSVERKLREMSEWQECFTWELLDGTSEEPGFFPFCFELLEIPSEVRANGLSFLVDRLDSCSERFELKLSCVKSSKGLWLELHYDAERLSAEYVEHLGEQLEALLEDARRHPDRRLSELDLLGDRRCRELLAVSSVPVRELGLHELFEEQARRSPEAPAVSFGQQSWSYRELNERANRLARHLRRQGVGQDDRVALVAERSLEMVLGLLGALKAGAAYIPVDPGYPAERVSYMLSDSGASVVLTPDLLKSDWSESGENLGLAVEPMQLAYVIYTSGSTGRPKGVMVSHGAIVNQMTWFVGTYPLDGSDVVLQKTPFSFDASVWEFYAPLLCGARLHLAEPGRHGDGGYLARTCRDEGVTVLQLVPSLLRVLLEEPLLAECRSLRRLFCGGEALSRELVVRAQSVLEAEVINLYGPTEATIQVLSWSAERPLERRTIPLGEPVWNTWSYVLDGSLRPCPVGVPGELYVGGSQLARGYLGRPELTAERFVPGSEPGFRLYRTGDLARYLPEGGIEFLGRVDQQVKVRGFRIELGEIESVLEEHPSVRQAVVVAREEGGVSRLVAYLSGESLAEGELRSWAGSRLPEHMVPTAFVALEDLPRLPNGKVDRSALPAPELLQSERESSGARTPTEELVAQLWSELLGLERVGVEEDFFELGGHSLLATQLTSRLAHLFRVELSLRTLFETPTVAGIASRIDSLRREEVAVEMPPIRPVSRDRELPLSFAQQRLWFLDQLAPGNAAYNISEAILLRGQLDEEALAESLRRILGRHEALRTIFPSQEGRPRQVILSDPGFQMPVLDLRTLNDAERESEARRLAEVEALKPFDLEHGPLFRATLLRLGETEQCLLLAMHHIVSDGWSMGLLNRDFSEIYSCRIHGAPPALPELPVQYADFACWQRGWLQGEALDRQLAYWRDELEDIPRVLELPTDRPRPAVASFHGAGLPLRPPAAVLSALGRLGRSTGTTLFMTLLGVFEILLHRYSGQETFTVGSPIANRNRAETENLIGFFVNTLVLRSDLTGSPSFLTLLDRVREISLGAYLHQDLPFEKLVEELQPVRDLSRPPLFQVALSLQPAPLSHRRLPGVELEVWSREIRRSRFDLLFALLLDGQGVVEYSTDLFDRATAERMAGHFLALLEEVAVDPLRPVIDLPMLPAAERHQVLVEWNSTAGTYPSESRLEELFEAQAARTPDAVAAVGDGFSWSYAELEVRANRIANLLRQCGAGPGSLVAVHLSRSPYMVAVILGALKAGAAYVPLESSFPKARSSWILSSLGIRHLLTDSTRLAFATELAEESPSVEHMVCIDTLAEAGPDGLHPRFWGAAEIDRQSSKAPEARGDSRDPAYIIFTSGSTGTPKGVLVRHQPAANLVDWVNRTFDIGPEDMGLFITALGFDLSVYDVFGLLAAGGCVRVISEADLAEPARLVERMLSEPITFWDSAPAALQQLVPFFPSRGAAGAERLRLVFLSGDWIPVTLPDDVRSAFPRSRIVGLGGATEATIWSNYFPIDEVDPLWTSIPYGRPIRNARYHVLDQELRPLPIGVPGDLYIGGPCLASGYAGDAVLTASKFVPDPFADTPGEVLYRTGDRARVRSDGNLQFLGRLDHQVKIRGFRIELGEIESTLLDHPAVSDAVVLVREDRPGNRTLVAYLVTDAEISTVELREHLRKRLPEYMLPSSFVFLQALPVTPNGKLDRKALPAPDSGERQDGLAPRSAREAALAEIWAEVLGLREVGVEDDFFELGGHSLVATQLMARVRTRFHVDLPLQALFQAPTVASLAERIAELSHITGEQPDLPVLVPAPESVDEPFPLNDVQQAYWLGRTDLFDLGSVASHAYAEVEVRGLELDRLNRALHLLIERHGMLRAVILADGRQRILSRVPPLKLPVRDLRGVEDAGEQLAAVRERMSHEVLPADRWPLFALETSLLDGDLIRLHVSLDALIADAWSFNTLVRELFELYEDPDVSLPPLTLSFRDYVLAEAALKEAEVYGVAERYWQQRLDLLPPAPELPLARDPASLKAPRFGRRAGHLSARDWEQLKSRAAGASLTPSGLVLAAFSEVLARWSKSPRFTLNVTLFNRLPLHPEVDRLVGDFTSLLLLAVDASGLDGFAGRARRIQEQLWQDLDHRYVSGVEVVRQLTQKRGLRPGAVMPIVLTSTLTLQGSEPPRGLDALEATSVFGISQTPQVWLDHQVWESEGELRFNWDAVEEIFPEGMLDDLFRSYLDLLSRLSSGEEAWSASLPPAPSWQERLREEVNTTSAPVPEGLLHQRFEHWARQHPEDLAVVSGPVRLSYGELLVRSLREAVRLRRHGACPESLVAVVMEKGWEQVVAVLGVLQSGAAYLPISADLPRERRWQLLRQGEAKLVLTQPHLAGTLEWPAEVEVFSVEASAVEVEAEPLEAVQRPEDLAYVIFTSGSTGVPKGVMIEHRSALNTVLDVNDRFGVGPGDRVLGLSSLSFDLSVYDVFGPLSVGGTVVLPEPDSLRDPERWAELISVEGVTVWNSVPALLEMLVEHSAAAWSVDLGSLRLVLLSGDWIPVRLPERLRSLAPSVRMVSLGGATEASIWSILYPIEEVESGWTSIPYGRPMVNQRFEVLDESLEPCPVWVPGELYIGGIGLARGYWRDEERTRGSFVRHPRTGERLYRTGDLGRWLPDGTIEFLGREDLQVKIQGYRIELGEIESVLERHPAVKAAAVLALGEPRAQRRLAAWIVPEGHVALDESELHAWLGGQLPPYMVPATFDVLEALPLTVNGKLDRAALAAAAPQEAARFEPPSDPLEQALAAVWAEVLRVERVGVRDSLFALGGNSLSAIQIAAQVRERCGAEVPLRALFENPTVAGLARVIRGAEGPDEAVSELPPLPAIKPDPKGRYQPFPLNDVQQAYWVGRSADFDLGNVASHGYSELEVSGLSVERMERVLQRLIARHDMLRMVVSAEGEQRILPWVDPYRIEVLDLRGKDPREIEEALLARRENLSHEVLPADRWPLFDVRATLLDEDRVRLHIGLDLLLADAWSARTLSREFEILYRDESFELPPLELSFRDYVLAEIEMRGNERHRRSREYWLHRLPALPPAPDLPVARGQAMLSEPRFIRRNGRLPAESWKLLKDRAARADLTPSGLLLSAFGEVLARWSRSPRFTLNVTLFNRLPLHPQINDIVGDFTSLTLVAMDHSRDGGFLARSRAAQEQLWHDLEHRFVSGVWVQRELARLRGRTAGALMPVVFTSLLFGDEIDRGRPDLGSAPRLATELIFGISQTPQVWLDHQVWESEGELRFNWDAVEEIFPEGMLDDLFGSYLELLSRLSSGEEAWSASLPPAPSWQERLREEVNTTTAPVPEGLLHQRFERWARQHSEDLAVVSGPIRLSYGELLGRSLREAVRLRRRGACPESLVAVVVEKGWEQVVAVLGVLQSGAAYLPISPDLPRERRWQLLRQGKAKLVLTQPHLAGTLEWPAEVEVLSVEASAVEDETEPLESVQRPEDLAYVIFTSGSTGVPKGVMVEHRSALNTVVDVNDRFGVGPGDRVLGLSSLSFDLSVYDVFGPLSVGGTLVLPEPESLRDPGRWAELISAEGVTVWNSVPALLEMLVEHSAAARSVDLGSLRLVLLSGDWIPVRLPDRLRSLVPSVHVVSLGGATEASIWSILYPIGEVEPGWTSIPYGRPMVNQRFEVLDESLEPCPVWVPGELYIGGIGLARGYWRDEERTRAGFVRHPRTGERLYRTGDLGRWLPDGTIEFLGREDLQVKIQGYRIELGEIESVLERHPAVKAAAVLALGEPRAQRRLAAWIVPADRLQQQSVPAPVTTAPAHSVSPETLLDSVDRLEFKLAEHGLRRDGGTGPTIHLQRPELGEELARSYFARRSHREFLSEPLPLDRLGELLEALAQVRQEGSPLPKYRYPSAGNLYPVQVYVWIRHGRVEGLAGGTYYYHPAAHRLIPLDPGAEIDRSVHVEVNRPVFDSACLAIFLIGQLKAIEPLYGSWSRDFCLLEAGAMSQLLMASAPAAEIGLCPIGALDFEPVRRHFWLDEGHVLLHSLLGGRIDVPAPVPQISLPSFAEEVVAPFLPLAATPAAGNQPLSDELRSHLLQYLPEYMVPSFFELTDALPLTANGKVDRKMLAARAPSERQVEPARFEAPRTALEEIFVGIWQDLLARERIGIHDNFFEIGGDSVLGVQFLARAQRAGWQLSARQLFEHQTIAGLACAAVPVELEKVEMQAEYVLADAGLDEDDLGRILDQFGQVEPDEEVGAV